MKFDAHQGDTGWVTDLSGKSIPYPIRGDTQTGWVECYLTDSNGQLVIDHAKEEVAIVLRRYEAPLQFSEIPPNFGQEGHKWATHMEERSIP